VRAGDAPAVAQVERRRPRPRTRISLGPALMAALLFAGMLALFEVGRDVGARQLAELGQVARTGLTAVQGAVYGLLGLLVGFSFSGAASRFDNRRNLVATEVTLVETAWLRVDALPAEAQGPVRAAFRRYVDAVLEWYAAVPAGLRADPAVAEAQKELWRHAIAATMVPSGDMSRMVVLPALNDMLRAVEQERLTRRIHPPRLIFAMLAASALVAAFLSGYATAEIIERNWTYALLVGATISGAIYVIIELEYPRGGLIRMTSMDRALEELRETL
jgi:hypothetical protein